jgi:formate/nitrite transporter FocA (FNT family)
MIGRSGKRLAIIAILATAFAFMFFGSVFVDNGDSRTVTSTLTITTTSTYQSMKHRQNTLLFEGAIPGLLVCLLALWVFRSRTEPTKTTNTA